MDVIDYWIAAGRRNCLHKGQEKKQHIYINWNCFLGCFDCKISKGFWIGIGLKNNLLFCASIARVLATAQELLHQIQQVPDC